MRRAANELEDVPSFTTADLISLMDQGLFLKAPFTNFFEDPGSSFESIDDQPFPNYGVIKGCNFILQKAAK